jgi:serine/threonine protein kinase
MLTKILLVLIISLTKSIACSNKITCQNITKSLKQIQCLNQELQQSSLLYQNIHKITFESKPHLMKIVPYSSKGLSELRHFQNFKSSPFVAPLVTHFTISKEHILMIFPNLFTESLHDKIRENQVAFDEKRKLKIYLNLLMLIQYFHFKNLIISNLSLKNIYVNSENSLILWDLSLLTIAGATAEEDYEIIGPFRYLFKLKNHQRVATFEEDIFAAGIILYNMIYGISPIKSRSNRLLRTNKKIFLFNVDFPIIHNLILHSLNVPQNMWSIDKAKHMIITEKFRKLVDKNEECSQVYVIGDVMMTKVSSLESLFSQNLGFLWEFKEIIVVMDIVLLLILFVYFRKGLGESSRNEDKLEIDLSVESNVEDDDNLLFYMEKDVNVYFD